LGQAGAVEAATRTSSSSRPGCGSCLLSDAWPGGLPCPWTRGTVDTVACHQAARGKRWSQRSLPSITSPADGRLRCLVGWRRLRLGVGHASTVRPDPSTLGAVGVRGSHREGRPPAPSQVAMRAWMAVDRVARRSWVAVDRVARRSWVVAGRVARRSWVVAGRVASCSACCPDQTRVLASWRRGVGTRRAGGWGSGMPAPSGQIPPPWARWEYEAPTREGRPRPVPGFLGRQQ